MIQGVSDDEAALRNALAALDAALEHHDVDAVQELCADDVVFIGSGKDEEAVGRDALVAMLGAIGPQTESSTFGVVWGSVHVEVSGDIAFMTALGTARASGVLAGHDGTRYRLTGILLRTGDRWLWRVHHGSEPVSW